MTVFNLTSCTARDFAVTDKTFGNKKHSIFTSAKTSDLEHFCRILKSPNVTSCFKSVFPYFDTQTKSNDLRFE